MSERGYFQLRWAVPGFSFILVVTGLNLLPLVELVNPSEKSEFLGIAIALLSLFTASAIGFLTTQVYWWYYNRSGEFMGLKEFRGIKAVLHEYGFSHRLNGDEKENKKIMAAILDFAVYLGAGDKLLQYVWRRWDIYHLLRTTCVALVTGALVGAGMRIYFEVYLLKVQLWPLEELGDRLSLVYLQWGNSEGVAFLLVLFAVFLLILVLWRTSQIHMNNYCPTWKAIVRKSMSEYDTEIKRAFPDYFEEILCPSCTKRISKEYKMCPYCGKELIFCPECSKEISKEYKFCPSCGVNLKE